MRLPWRLNHLSLKNSLEQYLARGKFFNVIVLLLQWCLTLYHPVMIAHHIHGILQTSILEWFAISSSKGFSQPAIEPMSPVSTAVAGKFFTTVPAGTVLVKSYYVIISNMSFLIQIVFL